MRLSIAGWATLPKSTHSFCIYNRLRRVCEVIYLVVCGNT